MMRMSVTRARMMIARTARTVAGTRSRILAGRGITETKVAAVTTGVATGTMKTTAAWGTRRTRRTTTTTWT
jgi:hypothetical protein